MKSYELVLISLAVAVVLLLGYRLRQTARKHLTTNQPKAQVNTLKSSF